MNGTNVGVKLTGWSRVGDLGFKLCLVVLFAVYAVMVLKNVALYTKVWTISSGVWIALAIGLALAESLPLLFGLLLRRNWARQLLMISAVLCFFYNRLFNYWAHPFSSKNSTAGIIGALTTAMIIVWICKSRWFSRYMCTLGNKRWFWISLSALITVIVLQVGFAVGAYGWTGKHLVKQVSLPVCTVEEALPEGWKETEAFGYIIPVPVEGTNDYITYDNGDAAYSFKQMDGTNLMRLAWMTACKPSYQCFSFAGLTSLERHYQQSYVQRFSLLYTLHHWIKPLGYSCSGFRSERGLDLMFELSTTRTRSIAAAYLEDPVTKEYRELILGDRPPWSEEEQLKLISRIRKANP